MLMCAVIAAIQNLIHRMMAGAAGSDMEAQEIEKHDCYVCKDRCIKKHSLGRCPDDDWDTVRVRAND